MYSLPRTYVALPVAVALCLRMRRSRSLFTAAVLASCFLVGACKLRAFCVLCSG